VSPLPVVVLKLGSSVLRDARDLPAAVHEIYRFLREGARVVAVVSAYGCTTDRLFARAHALDPEPHPDVLSMLAATGEARTVAELALALRRAGVDAAALDALGTGIVTDGPALDARPARLASAKLREALAAHAVVVVPGFVGVGARGETTLLGRGGSDLTALFLAAELGARRVRLVKDVDGVFERDPAAGPARRYATLAFADARVLGGRVVQAKALQLAERRGLAFEVAALGSTAPTRVGARETRLGGASAAPPRLRVALLGLGTVGLGVQRDLQRMQDRFDVRIALVRDRAKLRAGSVDVRRLVVEPEAVLACECDVFVELLGGVEPAATLARAALERGVDVVTANKACVVEHGRELAAIGARTGAAFLHSASVGGAVPVLETLQALAGEREVLGLQGIVNSTTNFVLDRIAAGDDLARAVERTRELGYCEADPRADLSGEDAAQKLELAARVAFGADVRVDWDVRRGILDVEPERVRALARAGGAVRLVASLERTPAGARARLEPLELPPGHPLADVRAESNRVRIEARGQAPIVLSGRGAGRWPTTESVIGDLLEVSRRRSSEARAHRSRLAAGCAAPAPTARAKGGAA
jgi:homoserine dehydrogenase